MRILVSYLVFTGSLVILVSLSILYNQRFSEYTRYTNAVEHTHTALITLNDLASKLKDAETSVRGFLLSNDSVYLENYPGTLDSIRESLADLKTVGIDRANRDDLIALDVAVEERIVQLNATIRIFVAGPRRRATLSQIYSGGREKMEQCIRLITSMKARENYQLGIRRKNKEFYELATPGFFIAIFGFTIITFCISFYIIIREFRSRLKYQRDLERKLIELDQSNRELEQIAFVTSHDLQEPLRKINTFCDRLTLKHAPQLDGEGQVIVSRISAASSRMRDLVQDLSQYTSLSILRNHTPKSIDVRSVITTVRQHYEKQLTECAATLVYENAPVIRGYPDQIHLLFDCLLDNSIKFSRKGTPLTIEVSDAEIVEDELRNLQVTTAHDTFTKIRFRDNGIGFDNAFADRMFGIFQRLHTQMNEYEGKGVGLALVKRVISNHNGFILAKGVPGQGAEFSMYFPKDV